MTRSSAREQAFILIFEKEFNGDCTLEQLVDAAREAELFETDEFALALSEKTLAQLDEIDAEIVKYLKSGWKLSRISKVALAILRLAVCELREFDDVPVAVSINEAVELAKKYAAAEDASFVNGLLASVSRGMSNA